MRNIFRLLLLATVLFSGLGTAKAQTTAQRLFGHQDDPFYGLTWDYVKGRSDTRDLTGDYPAVMGFDLGGIELGDDKDLDGVPFRLIHDEAVAQNARGGVVTFSWHPRNPLTDGNAWDVSDSTVVRSILPGGVKHEKFQLWMKRVADFLLTLTDK